MDRSFTANYKIFKLYFLSQCELVHFFVDVYYVVTINSARL